MTIDESLGNGNIKILYENSLNSYNWRYFQILISLTNNNIKNAKCKKGSTQSMLKFNQAEIKEMQVAG